MGKNKQSNLWDILWPDNLPWAGMCMPKAIEKKVKRNPASMALSCLIPSTWCGHCFPPILSQHTAVTFGEKRFIRWEIGNLNREEIGAFFSGGDDCTKVYKVKYTINVGNTLQYCLTRLLQWFLQCMWNQQHLLLKTAVLAKSGAG